LPSSPLHAVFGQTQPSEVRASGRGIIYLLSGLLSWRYEALVTLAPQIAAGAATCSRSPLLAGARSKLFHAREAR